MFFGGLVDKAVETFKTGGQTIWYALVRRPGPRQRVIELFPSEADAWAQLPFYESIHGEVAVIPVVPWWSEK